MIEYCRKHGSILQDFNGDGEPYRRPVCLDCRWESGDGRIIPKVIKVLRSMKKRFFFMLHYGPDTAYVRRHLTNRLNRVVKGNYQTLEEVAFAIGGAKREQPMRGPEYVPEQTNLVIATLRKFEEKNGTIRTKQTREEELEIKRQDDKARRRVSLDHMASLSDPSTVFVADLTIYRENGGAKKRQTQISRGGPDADGTSEWNQ